MIHVPDIISLAVRLFVAYEAGARFVQRLLAVSTTQTPDMPFQVGRHPQDVLVKDLIMAPGADGYLTTTSHQRRALATAAAASCNS